MNNNFMLEAFEQLDNLYNDDVSTNTKKLCEAIKFPDVELEYSDLHIHAAGNQRDVDDWDEVEYDDNYTYEAEGNRAAEALGDLLKEEDVTDIPGGLAALFNMDDDAYWSYMATHFDDLVQKYYKELLEYFRSDAEEHASENFDWEEYNTPYFYESDYYNDL